ncbi:MAG: TonB-dependent receptor plug domain-containing protein [Desulfamplus sp.]|nr:TonB-dependent receptor plug domain-containing protein [Desulfamplus sp.]
MKKRSTGIRTGNKINSPKNKLTISLLKNFHTARIAVKTFMLLFLFRDFNQGTIAAKRFLFYVIVYFIMIPLHLSASASFSDIDDTMLMFVGEELEIVTVASRTPESPSTAPAVVRVIDHNDILNYGYKTLAEVLSAQPGFYISDQGMGSLPYVRGISNGILILYDGVPVPTGGPRSYYPLDHELSLNSVKRIEIIRGPGSVLWGADAFAGIVNIVPFTGKDVALKEITKRALNEKDASKKDSTTNRTADKASTQKNYTSGGRAEASGGSGNTLKGFADTGLRGKNWDAYLSVYGAQNRYDNGSLLDVIFSEKDQNWIVGNDMIDNSDYREMTANFNLSDSFSVSGRISDFNKSYTQTLDSATEFAWPSEKKVPASFIKANYSKVWGGSHWNMTTYYQDVSYEQMDAGNSIQEDLNVFYGELLWDRRLLTRGLLTAGISYRENHVEGALVDGGFIPELLVAEYKFFKQPIQQMNYKNSLKSFFSQYRHPFTWGEFWAGFRFDDNSIYEEYAPSYTIGINIPLSDGWRVKTAFGTGYRTPYSQQWTGKELLTRDEVATLNLQAEWNSGQGDQLSVTTYLSRLSNNVKTDPFAGASAPSDQDFSGMEIYFKKKIIDKLEGYFSVSKIFYSEDEYHFSVISNTFFRPDGTRVDTYDTWSETYDPGADFMAASGLTWHILPKVDFALTASWTTPINYSYRENTITGEYDNPLLLNSQISIKNIPYDNIIFSVGCKNILDGDFTYPGFYGPVNGNPLTGYASIRFSF